MNSTLIFGTLGTVVAGVLTAMIIYWLKKPSVKDKDRFEFYRVVFNRPAFKGVFTWRCDMDEYVEALDETMKALNSGYFATFNDERNVKRAISEIKNAEWKATMENITGYLQDIKQVLNSNATPFEKAAEIDKLRDRTIADINKIFSELKIDPLKIPTKVKT
jgi:uncharacterized protein YukE